MKHLLALCLCVALCAGSLRAQVTPKLGDVARSFDFGVSRVLADPNRDRAYALTTSTNSVVVIDTKNLSVVGTVFIGSNPADLAISPDGNTLYVANSGSSATAVGTLNLQTLQAGPSLALPAGPTAIAAGLDGRLYVAYASNYSSAIYQISSATGAVQATLNTYVYNPALRLSPDLKTLYVAELGSSPSTLYSYDVSTTAPAQIKSVQVGSNANSLTVGHAGKYLCVPCGGGNTGGSYATNLYSTADIATYYGTFNTGAYPGAVAFSPDDSKVYQYRYSTSALLEFSTTTFAQIDAITSSDPRNPFSYSADIDGLVIDRTGSYLFVPQNIDNYDGVTTGSVLVLTTGEGTLTPPALLPKITVGNTSYYNLNTGENFSYQINATHSPTSYDATNLPPGLSVDATTGLISGAPTLGATSGSYNVKILATNAAGTATANLTLYVYLHYALPTITSSLTIAGTVGVPLTYQITATNNPNNYELEDNLPTGLSFNEATGTLSGTPTKAGTYYFEVDVHNQGGYTEGDFTLTVSEPIPIITSAASATATRGKPFTYQIAATNHPSSYSAAGLPDGLSIDTAKGFISGSPSVAGVFQVTIQAANSNGAAASQLTITVAPFVPTVSLLATVPTVTAGSGGSGVFTISRDGDLSSDLVVSLLFKGTAKNGIDYQTLKTTKKIKAGKSIAKVKITPSASFSASGKKTVKLTVVGGDGYSPDASPTAKVKILPAGR